MKSCKHHEIPLTSTSSPHPPPQLEEDNYDDNDDIENEISPIVECTIHDHEKCSPGTCVVVSNLGLHHQRKECECPTGFTAHNELCIDIDECRDQNLNECSHDCQNTYGSYYCSCPSGLKMSENRKDCDDYDECHHDRDICGELQCQNTFGGFKCLCEDGEEADREGKCRSKSLCEENNGGCSQ